MDQSKWWKLSDAEVCRLLDTDLHQGLSHNEAKRRLQAYGYNELPEQKRFSTFKLLIEQFSSFIVWVLLIAIAISCFLGEWIDAIAILVIVILNGLLGFFQEFRAEKSLAALRKMASPTSKVVREGTVLTIPSRLLVPGDLVRIEAGDRVSADGRIIQSVELATQEAALTGESISIHKSVSVIDSPDLPVGDRKNMGFLGTTVVSGKGLLLITETGLTTELGKIATLLQAGTEEPTPLQIRLEDLGHRLVWVCLCIVGVVFLLGFLRGEPLFENFLVAISLAVAAVPEGLPAVVTISLSLGVRRMVKRHALIRRLPSVETLGCTTVICTDKTGTLTQNEMVVRSIFVNNQFLDVTGLGYSPEGNFEINHRKLAPHEIPELEVGLKIGVLCNGAELSQNPQGLRLWSITGDPTEGALLSVAGKAGLFKQRLELENPLIAELPFDSERKRMSMLRQTSTGPVLFVKGAPDVILRASDSVLSNGSIEPLSKEHAKAISEANTYLASQALRLLAVGYRPFSSAETLAPSAESKLIFVALIAMMDPPRPEAKKSIETCKKAGITTVMITGDHKATAVAVAKELDLLQENSLAITGADLDQMDDARLKECVKDIAIYARTSAMHKLRIVRALKSRGEVVAMTGDGVNDAPAIKEADIGVAMGITGTDVTKEASDMVILDDNFASIVDAVEEGRGIYNNIIKFVNYLLSSNIAELLVIFIGLLFGFTDRAGNPFLPLTAVQLLWLNLVTDGLPALGLGLDPVDPTAMAKPPRKSTESILPFHFACQLFFLGCILAAGTLVACHFGLRQSVATAQTMALTSLVVYELIKVQMIRSRYNHGLFSNPFIIFALVSSLLLQVVVIYTPLLQPVFGTVPLHMSEWGVIIGIGAIVWGLSRLVNRLFR